MHITIKLTFNNLQPILAVKSLGCLTILKGEDRNISRAFSDLNKPLERIPHWYLMKRPTEKIICVQFWVAFLEISFAM